MAWQPLGNVRNQVTIDSTETVWILPFQRKLEGWSSNAIFAFEIRAPRRVIVPNASSVGW